MKLNRYVIAAAALLGAMAASAETLLIKNAKVHTLGAAGTLESADILVRDGKIDTIAPSIGAAADKVVDATGKVVTPGLIAPLSALGLTEIGAASSTNDYFVTGKSIGSAFDPLPAYNPKSTLIPFSRANGVTRALVLPSVSTWGTDADKMQVVFAGRGFAIELTGDFDSVTNEDVAQRAYLGETGAALAGGSRANALARLQRALSEAREYRDNADAIKRGEWRELEYALRDLEALQPVVTGEQPLIVHANRASDILQALKLAKENNLKLVIDGGAEAWMVAEPLAQARVPVIIDALNNTPISFESLGARLDNAALLNRAGVEVLISAPGYGETHLVHLSRQSAGNAVAHGLPYDEGLKAISANVADTFGLEGGALEPGAVADFVVWSGDPLEVTSFAEQVVIGGEPQSLENRSTRLRDRYLKLEPAHKSAYRK